MMNGWRHFRTIMHHKRLVCQGCFAVGLYWQGLFHDMSKFHPVEFFVGCKYYQGNRSPNNAERETTGVSMAWLHHKGRNKHHFEYWMDYGIGKDVGMVGMKMPVRYVVEMFMDRIAASKTYMKEAYTDASPLEYYHRGRHKYIIHPDTDALLCHLLEMLAEKGEKETFSYIKTHILKDR